MSIPLATLMVPINAIISISNGEAIILQTEDDCLKGYLAGTNSTMSSRGLRHSGILYAVPKEAHDTAVKEHMLIDQELRKGAVNFCLPFTSAGLISGNSGESFHQAELDLGEEKILRVSLLVYDCHQVKNYLVHLAVNG